MYKLMSVLNRALAGTAVEAVFVPAWLLREERGRLLDWHSFRSFARKRRLEIDWADGVLIWSPDFVLRLESGQEHDETPLTLIYRESRVPSTNPRELLFRLPKWDYCPEVGANPWVAERT